MSRKYELRLDAFGISKERYLELLYFCRQYPEWRAYLDDNTDTMRSAKWSKDPKGDAGRKDADAELAIRRAEKSALTEMIEQSAASADAELHRWIILNVAYGVGYERLRGMYGMPAGHKKFFQARRMFFVALDKKK